MQKPTRFLRFIQWNNLVFDFMFYLGLVKELYDFIQYYINLKSYILVIFVAKVYRKIERFNKFNISTKSKIQLQTIEFEFEKKWLKKFKLFRLNYKKMVIEKKSVISRLRQAISVSDNKWKFAVQSCVSLNICYDT